MKYRKIQRVGEKKEWGKMKMEGEKKKKPYSSLKRKEKYAITF